MPMRNTMSDFFGIDDGWNYNSIPEPYGASVLPNRGRIPTGLRSNGDRNCDCDSIRFWPRRFDRTRSPIELRLDSDRNLATSGATSGSHNSTEFDRNPIGFRPKYDQNLIGLWVRPNRHWILTRLRLDQNPTVQLLTRTREALCASVTQLCTASHNAMNKCVEDHLYICSIDFC